MVDVPDDLDALRAGWRKTSNNLFRSLKKADKAGLEFREGTSAGDLRSFHRMYVRTMKKHRSLPRSLRQLRLAQELLGEAFKVFIVSHGGRDVAGGVYHVFGDTVELVYNGSDEDALALRPNHALYWNVMQWAAARGLQQRRPRRRRRRHAAGRASSSSGARRRARASASPSARGGRADAHGGDRRDRLRRRGLREPLMACRVAPRAAPAPAARRARRLPLRMTGRASVRSTRGGRALGRVRARPSARDALPARRVGADPGRVYRFEPRYLALDGDGGELHGVLPLLYKKGLVSDARVRSLPVFPAGGPLADTREQEVALVRAARDSRSATPACSP